MVSRFAAHSQQNERDARPQGLFVNRRFGILLCGRMWATVSFFVVEMFLHLAIGCADKCIADHTLLHTTTHIYGRCETSYMQLMSVGRVTLKLVLRGIQSLTNVDMH